MKRSEQKLENTWKIEDIFVNVDAFWSCLDSIKKACDELRSYQGKLNDPTSLFDFLQAEYGWFEKLENCRDYATLQSDQDGSNAFFQDMKGKVFGVSDQLDSALSFVSEEILQIEDLESFYKEKPELEMYRRVLDDIVRKKAHTLPADQEKILSLAASSLNASERAFYILNDTDMQFCDVKDRDGNVHSLTTGSYIDLVSSKDRVLRKAAFDSLYASYEKLANTFASLLNSHCGQLKFLSDLRGYSNSLEASLDQTEVPVSVYHNLIEAVHQDIGILHKYMKVRKKYLGIDSVHMYDLYTSLVPDCEKEVSFEMAKKECLDSVQLFGDEYAKVYETGLNSRWLDVYENEGKRSGAYSNGANVHPFVLLNHTSSLHSEFTLAHEMGHAMHSYLSNHAQPYCTSKYKIFVAEVASTCNEALLMNKLQNEATDPKEKAYLINYFLEQFRTTLYRQCLLAEFEMKINERVAKNETLSVDVLNSIYHDLNVFYYGPDCTVDEAFDYEWAKIPHLYMNYYLYQYATGFSAAMALSQKILHGSQMDVDAYLTFLRGGSSKTPIDLLKGAGVDMTTPEPIHAALSMFSDLIDEFDKIMESLKQ